MAITGAGLAAARKDAKAAVSPVQTSDPVAASAYFDAIDLADSTAIVNYFKANTELDPKTTDSGAAGSGIITGGIK